MATEIDARGVPQARWPLLLKRLVAHSILERRRGLPPLARLPHVRYVREPKRSELWQSAARTAQLGYGDCEDLAIALSGDFNHRGIRSDVITKFVRPGLRHALTRVWLGPKRFVLIDPSRARGMRGAG